ncbi:MULTISPECIES: hypothetical protein [unclassified Undibacterium]|uniref:hypothetical protein n=1 Tax=unclassified Undibacterium TaxID=2630295 RepID=UPI003C2ADD63
MSAHKFSVRRLFRYICALSLFFLSMLAGVTPPTVQAQTAPTKVVNNIEDLIPEMTKAGTVDAVLAMMRPPVSKTTLIKSDYLLLDSPTIALPGIMTIRMVSEIPGTEFFMLFNQTPADKEPMFITAVSTPGIGKAEAKIKAKFSKNADLLLVVKAGGRWYSVANDIKIATK